MFPFPAPLLCKGMDAGGGGSFSFNGSSDYMEMASAARDTVPVSFAIWFKPNLAPATAGLLSLSSGTTARYALENVFSNSSTLAMQSTSGGGTRRGASAPSGWTTGAWNHGAGWITSTSSKCYLNGTPGSAGLSGANLVGLLSKTTIGCSYSSGSRFEFTDGLLAHAAIWDIALSDAEVATLAAGTLPTSVQAAHLIFYADLQGGIAKDSVSGNALTVVGAVSSPDAPL